MTTFAGWLNEQRKREDAVGWFSRYWRDLPETPRLSSPSSIASHLEDRTTKPGQNKAGERLPFGFTDPDGGNYVRDAYDATLAEYRKVRDQIVQSAAEGDGVAPGTPEQPPGPQSPAGFAVEAATQAAMMAAARHQVPDSGAAPAQVTISSGSNSEAILIAIARDLELIKLALGIARDEDGGIVRFPPAAMSHVPWTAPDISGQEWADWYEQAAVFATAHGPGWDADGL